MTNTDTAAPAATAPLECATCHRTAYWCQGHPATAGGPTLAAGTATDRALERYTRKGGNRADGARIIADALAQGYGLAADLWYYGFTTRPAAEQAAADIAAEQAAR